ncbi:MAG: hypothetical protein M3280_02925 [Actinomycetota bacterium]|nr:hypothetical protein [Actinomycetota bacterium]
MTFSVERPSVLSTQKLLVIVKVHSLELEHGCAWLLQTYGYEYTQAADRAQKETYLIAH